MQTIVTNHAQPIVVYCRMQTNAGAIMQPIVGYTCTVGNIAYCRMRDAGTVYGPVVASRWIVPLQNGSSLSIFPTCHNTKPRRFTSKPQANIREYVFRDDSGQQ